MVVSLLPMDLGRVGKPGRPYTRRRLGSEEIASGSATGGSTGVNSVEQLGGALAETSFGDSEELRGLISLGRDQGYLTFERIASTLEEVDVSKEQLSQLHSHLIEH